MNKELLETISRADTCNRDCGKCDLVQDTDELKAMYNLNGSRIFDDDCMVCESGDCIKCVTKWLEAERLERK